jgi:hypothetical protein
MYCFVYFVDGVVVTCVPVAANVCGLLVTTSQFYGTRSFVVFKGTQHWSLS